MRSGSTEAACCVDPWGYLTVPRVYHLSTLRRFDTKLGSMGEIGPLIPCERRLAETEIQEFQEVTFRARFGNREYDRPYGRILVTLRRFN